MKLNNRIIKALYEAKINSSINESYATVKDRFIRDGADKTEVKSLLDLHKKLKDMRRLKAEEINIDSFAKGKSFEEFKSLMDKYSESDTKTKSDKFAELKKKIVAQDSKWTVYKIDTSEEAYLFHGLTKWCIVSGTKEDAKRYFLKYKDKEESQFYFIVRNKPQNNKWDYIALQHQIDKDTYWDKEDKEHEGDSSEIRELKLPNFKKENWKFTIPDNWKLNSDGSYDVDGSVGLSQIKYVIDAGKLTVKFGKVSGHFDCSNSGLTSLEGCPKEVGGNFYCRGNKLTSLEGCPTKVSGWFSCLGNKLTSLEGCPKEVGRSFYCHDNYLTSLEGSPKEVGGDFNCSDNNLTSLEGAPTKVGGGFACSNNKLTSLEGGPKEIGGSFYCNDNRLTSLKGGPKEVGGNFYCGNNEAKFTEDDVSEVCKVKGDIYC